MSEEADAGPARRRRRQLTSAMDDAAGKEGSPPPDKEDQAKTQAAANALSGKPAEHSHIHDKVNQHRRAIHSAAHHPSEVGGAAFGSEGGEQAPDGEAGSSEIQPVQEGEAGAAPAANEGETGEEGAKAADITEAAAEGAGVGAAVPSQPTAPKEEEPMDERVLQVRSLSVFWRNDRFAR